MTKKKVKGKKIIVRAQKRPPGGGPPIGVSKTVYSEAEGKRVYPQLVLKLERKIASMSKPTWRCQSHRYFRWCEEKGLTQKTIYNAQRALQSHTFDCWGDKLIDEITANDIRVLVKNSPRLKSEGNRKSLLKFIRGVFDSAVDSGVLKGNPTPMIKFRVGDKLRQVLTESQVKHLLEKAVELDWEWCPHVTLALYTGMRNGELFALTWDKVSFETRKIKVDRSWNNKDSFKSTKSGDDRTVEMADNLIGLLKRLKLENSYSEFVLPRLGRWDKGEQARELRMFLKAIGLPPVRFHDLRATWCTLMLSKGKIPAKVMKMGGWKDLKTMERYLRLAGVDIEGITDGFDLHDPIAKQGKLLPLNSSL